MSERWWKIAIAALLWLAAAAAQAQNISDSLATGTQWLLSARYGSAIWVFSSPPNPDQTEFTADDFTRTYRRDTFSAVAALKEANAALEDYQDALGWIRSENGEVSLYASHRIEVLALHQQEVSASLGALAAQVNPDGGIGTTSGYPSNVLDTAAALIAFGSAGQHSGSVASAVSYLLAQQNADGGWAEGEGGSVFLTTHAVRGLWYNRSASSGVPTALSTGEAFLLSQRDAAGNWQTRQDTALAVIALAPYVSDPAILSGSVNGLLSAQQTNGSWDNDVYTTALALRAIKAYDDRVAATPAPNPIPDPTEPTTVSAGIAGYVLKAGSGEPVVGAVVSISEIPGITTNTDSHGHFLLANLPIGSHTVIASQPGFTTVSTVVEALRGQLVLARTIVLSQKTGVASIQGSVVDGDTRLGLKDTEIFLVGSSTYSAVSDDHGRFYINGVAPGSYEINFARAYFNKVSGAMVISAEEQRETRIAMTRVGSDVEEADDVSGVVLDGSTGYPILNAEVSFGGAVMAVTSAQGVFRIADLERQTYVGSVTAQGYQPQPITFFFCSACTGNAGTIVLYPRSPSASPTSLTLVGSIVDSKTWGYVPGAEITAVSAGATVSATAADDGTFKVEISSNSFQLTIRAAGYQPAIYTITTPGLGEQKATLVLTPSTDTRPHARSNYAASGVVVDSVTRLPLNATISGSCGGMTFNVNTNSAGMYLIPDLPEICDLHFRAQNYPNESYYVEEIRATLAPLTVTNLGSTILQRVNSMYAELFVVSVERSRVIVNPRTLELSGTIDVEVRNAGYSAVSQHPFSLRAFHDSNGNGQFDENVDPVIGQAVTANSVDINQSVIISVSVRGMSKFRDEPIYVWVDAEKSINELDESNNVAVATLSCAARSTAPISVAPGFKADIFVTSVTNQQGPTQMAFDSKDNLYIATGSGSTILKIPAGTTTGQAFGFGHGDPDGVAVDSQDNVIVSDGIVKKYTSEGALIWQSHYCIWGSNVQGAAVDAEDRIYVGQTGGVACRYMPDGLLDKILYSGGGDFPKIGPDNLLYAGVYGSTGTSIAKSTLDGVRLEMLALNQGGGALAFDPSGDLIFGTSGSSIKKMVFPAKTVSTFASGFKKAQAVAFDNNGALYVGDYGTKTIYRITDIRRADLTTSLLKLIDNGAGLPASLTVRVGNGGAAASPEGIVLSFYQGDPAGGGALLATIPIERLTMGEYRDIRVDNVVLSGNADIFVVVDSDDKLTECNEANNALSIELPVANLGLITVSTDKAAYGPSDAVSLKASVSNTSGIAADYTVVFAIEDSSGSVVTSFEPIDVSGLPSTATASVSQAFNTATILAGNYVLRGILRNSEVTIIHAAESRFSIKSAEGAPTLLLYLSTDRASYHTTDRADIKTLVANNTVNTVIDGAVLRLSITNGAGEVVFTQDSTLAQLPPGGIRDLLLPYYLEGAPIGIYKIAATVLNKTTQALLASAVAQYQVISDLNKSLSAKIALDSLSVEIGTDQVCTTTLTNSGSVAANGLEIHEALVNIDTETMVSDIVSEVSLNAGASKVMPRTFATGQLTEGNYACVVRALIDGSQKTLAYAPFKLRLPPIRVDAAMKTGSRGRLLVLLDTANRCEPGNSQSETGAANTASTDACAKDEDPHGPKSAPTLSAQRQFLEALLKAEGWSYTITDSAESFTEAFHTGTYSAYALLSEQEKLSEVTHSELREAVHRGEGLLLAGPHDGRNQHRDELNDALGIKPIGAVADAARLEIPHNSLELPGTLSLYTDDKAIRIERTIADMLATYGINGTPVPSPDDCVDPANPGKPVANCYSYLDGLTETAYGQGKSVFAGFDLLALATRDGETSDAAKLLKKLLTRIAPIPAPVIGGTLPVEVSLTNKGMATPVTVNLVLPEGVSIIDANGAEATATTNPGETRLVYTTRLDVAEEETWTFYLRLPENAGNVVLNATVEAQISSGSILLASPSLTLTVPEAPTLDGISQTLKTLATTKPDYAKALKQAQSDIDKAIKATSAEDQIGWALKATNTLIGITDPDIQALRIDIDRWVRVRSLGSFL